MAKVDFKKELKNLYAPSAKEIVKADVPPMNFLMIDGKGDPNISKDYPDAIEALFAMSYTLKFMVKKSPKGIDYSVMPLEGLWWADDMNDFILKKKDRWYWTAMIMQPDFVSKEMVEQALIDVEKKKSPPALKKIRFEKFHEGQSAQILYIGPYADEGPTIKQIHDFIFQSGHKLSGKHHEIYLSDFRKTAPEKLKTIIRQPMV